jgi:tripartite-type tricarboxylate transporter receptor subunit TctC
VKRIVKRREVLAGLSSLAAMTIAPQPAAADTYPDRPIRLVIPFPPGGVYDALGRPWAEKMRSLLGTVVVENQGGAGGSIGAAAVARALPDGYTLLLGGGGSQIINPIAAKRPLYNPVKDFAPIVLLAITGLAIVTHPSVPARSLRELIDYARANPGKLSYGSAGVGSFNHLTGELFKSLTGTDIVHVPYKGAGPALTDAVSGHIPVVVPNITGQVMELASAGKLNILAVTTPARMVALPDTPTAIELGVAGMIARNFLAVFAPAGTPQEVVTRVLEASRAALADTEFQKILVASGFEPQHDMGPDETRQFVQEELARWTPVIKKIGLTLD